ncbi:MAG: aspartate carbamoyltransferase, partial [Candidatus Obscuribacterales bacterium]|nr:aspartate carbamoyltransferase [Candidatus Obscuribacterales bacterium]
GVSALIQRHSQSGSAQRLTNVVPPSVSIINAGDGWNSHPTQALLDYLTMSEVTESLQGKKVVIVGDIKHSRVARSNIHLLNQFGVDIHVCGPPPLMPSQIEGLKVTAHTRLEEALIDADFIMALRLQKERQQQGLITSTQDYAHLYRIDHKCLNLARPGVKVMHPGPVNRGVEITGALADDPNLSLITTQVTNGIAVRMAVLLLLLKREDDLL